MRNFAAALLIGVLSLAAATFLTGCGVKMPGKASATKKVEATSSGGGGGGGGGGFAAQQNIRQAAKRAGDGNELRGIALVYIDYHTNNGRAPSKLDDIKPGMQRDIPKGLAAIQEGVYEMVWGVPNMSSSTVIAYVKDPDSYGTRLVAYGDGRVERKTDAEFKAAVQKR